LKPNKQIKKMKKKLQKKILLNVGGRDDFKNLITILESNPKIL